MWLRRGKPVTGSLQSAEYIIYVQHGNVFYVKFWINIIPFLSHYARRSQSVGVSGAHQTRISSLSLAMVSILSMGRVSRAFVFSIMLIGLMVGLTLADSTNHGGDRQQVHSRRLLPNSAATPLPPFRSASICAGLGPVCPGGMHIKCTVGGVVGCICSLVRTCQPNVSGCTLFHGASKTPCGF